MIDIHGKEATLREAAARCRVRMNSAAIQALDAGSLPKGDALAAARTAGVLAAKQTAHLIPLCHPIPLAYVGIEFQVSVARKEVVILASTRAEAATGPEMEALTAASVAALTIHDMCKALDPETEICQLLLVSKSGGKTGPWRREGS
jgi:cyclic pyranopterin phosphate synthase